MVRRPCLFLCVVLLSGCSSNPLGALSDETERYGFTLYNPPRANHGPGWVFRFVKTFDGKTVPSTVCVNLFPNQVAVDGKLSLPSISRTDSVDVNFGVGLLDGLLKNVQKASADLSTQSVRVLTVKWGEVIARELPEDRVIDGNGRLIPVAITCAARLRELRASGQLDGVYVVQQALLVKSLLVSIDSSRNAEAKLDVSLYKALDVRPEVKIRQISNSSVEIADPRFVGFIAVGITGFIPTDQLGVEAATVAGVPLTPEQARQLLR